MAPEHDLPPRWDGHEVRWTRWVDQPMTTLRLHHGDAAACPECGSHEEPRTSRGTLLVHAPDVVRFGRTRHVPGTAPADPFELRGRPVASRCPDCENDQVTDTETGEVWELDADDYTDAGSWDARPTLF